MNYSAHIVKKPAKRTSLDRYSPFLLFLLYFTIQDFSLLGQDKIYLLDNSEIDGRVQQVDKKLRYSQRNGAKEKTSKVPMKKVGIIRYQNGLLHAFGGGRERQLSFNMGGVDRIFLVSGKVIPIELKGIYADHIEYVSLSDPARDKVSSPKSGVLALLQQGKEMVRYTSVSKLVASFLRAEELPIIAEVSTSHTTPAESSVPSPTPIEKNDSPASSSTTSESSQSRLINIDQEEFKQKALDKTRRLSQYIGLIANKSTPIMEANQAVSQAITLFISDSSIVQVSNVKAPSRVREFYIRQYLENVKLLKYDRVEIEWVDISYVGQVRKGPDGNYYGTITFVQKFRGIKDNQVVYEDQTFKRVEVVLKTYGKNFMGTTEELWDVFLSNIKVEHTTSY